MPLFQKTVLTKYLKAQDKSEITSKWEIFKSHFHNPTIQENIRNSKEEQYQGEFLIDLFVKVLGYTNLKGEIEKTDNEIDRMVYKLYGLTEKEIEIFE